MLLPNLVLGLGLLASVSRAAALGVRSPEARNDLVLLGEEGDYENGPNLQRREDALEWCTSGAGKAVGCIVAAGVAVVIIVKALPVAAESFRNWRLTRAQVAKLINSNSVNLDTWQQLPSDVQAKIYDRSDNGFREAVQVWKDSGFIAQEPATARANVESWLKRCNEAVWWPNPGSATDITQRVTDYNSLSESVKAEIQAEYAQYGKADSWNQLREWADYDMAGDALKRGIDYSPQIKVQKPAEIVPAEMIGYNGQSGQAYENPGEPGNGKVAPDDVNKKVEINNEDILNKVQGDKGKTEVGKKLDITKDITGSGTKAAEPVRLNPDGTKTNVRPEDKGKTGGGGTKEIRPEIRVKGLVRRSLSARTHQLLRRRLVDGVAISTP